MLQAVMVDKVMGTMLTLLTGIAAIALWQISQIKRESFKPDAKVLCWGYRIIALALAVLSIFSWISIPLNNSR